MGRLEQGQAPTPAGERGKGCPAVSEEAQLARIEGGDRPRPSHQPAARGAAAEVGRKPTFWRSAIAGCRIFSAAQRSQPWVKIVVRRKKCWLVHRRQINRRRHRSRKEWTVRKPS